MFPDELLQAIKEHPVCYMAYGLAEPHGAYNALGLDWLKAYSLCEKAARANGGIVAPPMCWHIQERPQFDWPKLQGVEQSLCSSLPADLFLHIVFRHLRVFDARGFHAAILVAGRYGGLEKDMRLVCDYYKKRSGSPLQIRCVADGECINFEDYKGDHAGLCETQQLTGASAREECQARMMLRNTGEHSNGSLESTGRFPEHMMNPPKGCHLFRVGLP